MSTVLSAQHVTHRFGKRKAIDDLSFTIEKGRILCLAGHNGSGKTTLIRILAGLIHPTRGRVEWERDSAHRCGLMLEQRHLYPDLTAEENLRLFGTILGTSREGVEGTIARYELEPL